MALLLLLGAVPACAASEWLDIKSPNFQLYTNARAGDARKTIEYFEQVRDFFMRVKSTSLTTRLPVTIILFRSAKDYKPYSASEVASAYYLGDQSRDYIVMSGGGEENYPIAVHEYMHLLIRHLDLKLPVWLNEGIAEVYSTMKPLAGKVLVGSVPQGRGYSLANEKWLTPEQLFGVRHDSPEYNEKNRSGILYAQSWMLTHMLMLDQRFNGKMSQFLALISAGEKTEDAFVKVYGRTAEQVGADMKAYFRTNRLNGALFDTRLQKMTIAEPTPADPVTVELNLARLVMMLNRWDEARTRLQRLAADNPKRWEIWEALGHGAWRQGDLKSAREHFRRAIEQEPPAWNLYWDYARVAANDRDQAPEVISALHRSLRLNGNNLDARLMLGWKFYETQRHKDAFEAFATIRNIDGERAPRLFLGIAYAATELQNWQEARSAAEKARKFSREFGDISAANNVLEYLDRREQALKRADATQTAESFAPMPTPPAAPSDEVASLKRPGEETVELRGILQQVHCDGTSARLELKSGQRQTVLLIDNPDTVIYRNAPGNAVNMTCGVQPAGRIIVVEYVERDDPATKTSGIVRAIEFPRTSK
ncbi:MAG TPA: tetratricopeptide repeat protein [Bryobacteraceae bacterium]|nr:tetratricopeptide repeat protein [Bryobacteraceae bacterium]